MNRTLAAASDYAHLGWSVLPVYGPRRSGECSCQTSGCASVGKHPRTKHGLKDATTDLSIISDWFTEWPEANVGIRTGGEGGFFALDVDPRNGGLESFQELTRGHSLPPTISVATPGSGYHLYLSHMGLPLASTTLAPGIDIKANGGYVIGPPSLSRNGVQYAFGAGASPTDIGIANTPDWLLALLPLTVSPAASPSPLAGTAGSSSGLRRPLSEKIGHLLLDGDLARRYNSRSETIQAIATEAVRNYWTEDELFRVLWNPSNRGGTKVQEMPLYEARTYVARSWNKAQSFLSNAPTGPPPHLAAQLQRIREHTARIKWAGTAGATDWAVMNVLIGVAERACTLEVYASARIVAEKAGVNHTTAANSLRRLTVRGLINRVGVGDGGKAAVYRLVMHNDGHTQVTSRQEGGFS